MLDKKMFNPGIYDISIEEYHSSGGISRSGIMEFKRSPRHFWYKYLNPDYIRKSETSALSFGSAVHCYILEPDKFLKQYYIPEKNPHHHASTAGKEFKANILKESEGKTILDCSDLYTIEQIHKSLHSDPQVTQLINDAQYEQSIYWIDPETQLLCKVRPDIMHDNFIIDLKTTNDASYSEFQRAFYKYGYHLQLAMMHEALKHTQNKLLYNFIDLVIEKAEPFCHAIYPIDEEAIEFGLYEFRYYLNRIKECFDKNHWSTYKTQVLSLPYYAKPEEV